MLDKISLAPLPGKPGCAPLRAAPASLLGAALGVALYVAAGASHASDADYKKAVASLEEQAYGEAIDRFELLADRGVRSNALSFNRGLAYAGRAQHKTRQPGDLGRAAASFSEALALDPSDEQADEALKLVREAIGRRRAREGADQIVAEADLWRALVSLVPENVWARVAAAGSGLLTVGLMLRLWKWKERVRLAGTITSIIGAVLLLCGGSLLAGASHYRRTSKPAVVVVSEARLRDDAGRPLKEQARSASVLVEGAEVYVLEDRGALLRVEWAGKEGWVPRGQLQLISADSVE